MSALLDVKNMCVDFSTDQGTVHAVRDVSFQVGEKEVLGLVGESGCGKSQTMYSVMGLLAENGHMTGGEITFEGYDLTRSHYANRNDYRKQMWDLRGNEISMIFQDPLTFLNPVLTIGKQLMEPLLNHTNMTHAQARARAIELMELVGIPSPEKRLHQYPHEFSGGMRQRIVIAIALACNPKLIIADEPTTALDVTIQAQVLELIQNMSKESGSSVIMITHDLGVVARMCDRIAIMYGGKIVEVGTDEEIFYEQKHPYTRGLLACVHNPEIDQEKLEPIPGSPPDLLAPPAGCPFVDRCDEAMRICKERMPKTREFSPTHQCACWLNDLELRRKETAQ